MPLMLPALAALVMLQVPNVPLPTLAVMPVVLKTGGGQEQRTVLTSVLTDQLARQNLWRVLSMDEVEDLLRNEQDRQSVGCSDDSCMAELAGALGARFLVTGDVVALGDMLLWTASLLDQGNASVLQRASLSGRTLQALVMQAEDMASSLAGHPEKAGLVGDAAMQRLGFRDAAGLAAFKTHREAHAEDPLPDVLTDFILEKNQESRALAVAEVVAFGSAAGLVVLAGSLSGVGLAFTQRSSVEGYAVAVALIGPVLLVALMACLAGGTGMVLSIVDALDLGRVSVEDKGCCRDDARIVEAGTDKTSDRLAGWVALVGGLAPLGAVAGWTALSVIVPGFITAFAGPADLSMEKRAQDAQNPLWVNLSTYSGLLPCGFLCAAPFPFCLGVPAGLLLLLAPRKDLIDDDGTPLPAPKKPAAAKVKP